MDDQFFFYNIEQTVHAKILKVRKDCLRLEIMIR